MLYLYIIKHVDQLIENSFSLTRGIIQLIQHIYIAVVDTNKKNIYVYTINTTKSSLSFSLIFVTIS